MTLKMLKTEIVYETVYKDKNKKLRIFYILKHFTHFVYEGR